jgi:hypothetical protein
MRSHGKGFVSAIAALLILAGAAQSAHAQSTADRATDAKAESGQSRGPTNPFPAFSTKDLYVKVTVKTDWKAPCLSDVWKIAEVRLVDAGGKETVLMSIASNQVFTSDTCDGATTLSLAQAVSGKPPGTYRLRINVQPVLVVLPDGRYGSASVEVELDTKSPYDDKEHEVLKMEFPAPGVPTIECVFDFT